MNNFDMTFLLLLTNQVILPLIFVIWLYQIKPASRSNLILQVIFTGSLVAFTWILGPQSWTGVLVGLFILIFYIAAVVKKVKDWPDSWAFKMGDDWKQILFTCTQILLTLIFLPICLFGLSGYSVENENTLSLEFPLKDGIYIVGHGGDTPLINYHNVTETQKYALDISKLNAIGTRVWGVYPKELDRYAIFEEQLYSPCDGTVKGVTGGYKDLNPPERGDGHPAGNHVVLNCDGVEIYIAHMKQNSIVVDSADVVQVGDLLGEVGNSGNTSEPHLHIHGEKDGVGVPILFNDRFLVRNSLVWR